jgi:hypothetical protein
MLMLYAVRVRAHVEGGSMRLASAHDLGLYVRDRRRHLGMTQAALVLQPDQVTFVLYESFTVVGGFRLGLSASSPV